MQKQGRLYLKLLSVFLAVLLGVYALGALLGAGRSYTLVTAVCCEVGDGLTVSGFVVRQEQVLVSTMPVVVWELSAGDRVGGGQPFATGYFSAQAGQRRAELDALKEQRAALLAQRGGITEQLAAVNAQAAVHELRAAKQTAALLALTPRDADKPDRAAVRDLDERIAALEAELSEDAAALTAASAGYVCPHVDGYESVLTPEALETMTLAELRALPDAAKPVNADAVGRLAVSQHWYFVCEIPGEAFSEPELEFTARPGTRYPMRIERCQTESGVGLLVLSCDRGMGEVVSLRREEARLTFASDRGLRVPKAALYYENGETGVYILENSRAVWKPVTLLSEWDEFFLAEWDRSGPEHLWPGDEMILTDKDIASEFPH